MAKHLTRHRQKQPLTTTADASPSSSSSSSSSSSTPSSSSPSPMKFIPLAQLYSPPLPPVALTLSASKRACRKLPFHASPNGEILHSAPLVYHRRGCDRGQQHPSEDGKEKEKEKEKEKSTASQVQSADATLPEIAAQAAAPILDAEDLRLEERMMVSMQEGNIDSDEEEKSQENGCSLALPFMQICSVNREDISDFCSSNLATLFNYEESNCTRSPIPKVYTRKRRGKKVNRGQHQTNAIEQGKPSTSIEPIKNLIEVRQNEKENGLLGNKDVPGEMNSVELENVRTNEKLKITADRNAITYECQINRHESEIAAIDKGGFDFSLLGDERYIVDLTKHNNSSPLGIFSLDDQRITDDMHSKFLSNAVDDSLQEQNLASIQNVPPSEASLTSRTLREMPNWICNELELSGIEEKQKNSEVNVELNETRTEQGMNMATKRAELKPNSLPARKKRKMQRVIESACPVMEKDLNDMTGCNLANQYQQYKAQRNLNLNTPSQHRQWKWYAISQRHP